MLINVSGTSRTIEDVETEHDLYDRVASNRVIRLTWAGDWPRNQTIFATALVDYDCDGDCCDDSNCDDSGGGGGNGGGADGGGGGGGGGSHDGCSGDSGDGGEIEN